MPRITLQERICGNMLPEKLHDKWQRVADLVTWCSVHVRTANRITDTARGINDCSYGAFFGNIQTASLQLAILECCKLYEFGKGGNKPHSIFNLLEVIQVHPCSDPDGIRGFMNRHRRLFGNPHGIESSAVGSAFIEHSLTFLKRPRTQGWIKHCRTHRDKWIAHADAGHVIPEAVDLIPVIKLQNIASWIANVIRIGWFERHYGDDIIHSRMNMLIELK